MRLERRLSMSATVRLASGQTGGLTSRLFHLFSVFLVTLALSACGAAPPHKQQAYVFGTLVEVSVQGVPEAQARQAADAVLAEFDRLHRLLHAWEPSALEGINSAIAVGQYSEPVPGEVITILRDAAVWSARGGKLFNPALGNLIRLWGFHSDTFNARMPDPAELARLQTARPTMADLRFQGNRVGSVNHDLRLDLGGYAKGYALDRAATILRGMGIRNALINIGGNILALGQRGNRPWTVGIQHPRHSGAMATLAMRDGEAIGTSGDYQRFFELDGKRYCHLIDPRTGWPAQDAQSVTVLVRGAEAGTRSDVGSKPLFIAGSAHWRTMASQLAVTDVLFIDGTGRPSATPSMASRLDWLDKNTTLSIVN